ncbi:MAG TPA: M23 family metallopeptidase [Ferrovibrio sp.]|uniref:M23 family metallopeptidase n=1 Tax=Ferrovibrio sp. TaxID=1917215 RepID=UPI002ED4BDAB
MRCLLFALIMIAGLASAARASEPPPGIAWQGDFIQGGLVIGVAQPGITLRLGGHAVPVAPDGHFVFGFGRDEAASVPLQIDYGDGRSISLALPVEQRQYHIQRIDGLPEVQVTPPPEVLDRIKRENEKIAAVRARGTPNLDFLQGWIWPAKGTVSGVYGSQRILNGHPKQPHYGLDIAAPKGTPVVATTDGVVVLAEPDLYYTGGTVIIDHGMGVTAAYLHMQTVLVKAGQRVRQGEQIGTVGATGRATGPHLDWRVNWFDVRIDPQRLLPKLRS